jgi:CheY-like chemotaxis protein
MNGLELAAHLRADQETEDIPIVMVTSRSTAKHREQAHAAGIDAFITKPYQDDELAEQIRLLIPSR